MRRDGVEIISGGRRYRWIGPGYGAQLESFEWLRPPAGAQRQITAGGLGSVRFYIFQTRRRGLRVRCSWGVSSSGSLDVHQERIYQARRELFL